jgi:hypothetical protein
MIITQQFLWISMDFLGSSDCHISTTHTTGTCCHCPCHRPRPMTPHSVGGSLNELGEARGTVLAVKLDRRAMGIEWEYHGIIWDM